MNSEKKIINTVLSLWAMLVFIVIICSISKEAPPIPKPLVQITNFFFPQGRSFFTKDPTEYNYDIYKITKDSVVLLIDQKHSGNTNLYGLSRVSRSVGREVSILLKFAENCNNKWFAGKGAISLPVNKNVCQLSIPNIKERVRYLEPGSYLIVKYRLMPIEWLESNQEQNLPWEGLLISI